MAFAIVYKRSAKRELADLPRHVRRAIRRGADTLITDPRLPANADWLRGKWEGYWRLVVGEYRVIYVIDDPNALITIVRVRHRSDAYEGGPDSPG